jgi:peroxin-4
LADISSSKEFDISVSDGLDDILHASLDGPESSPYAGGRFRLVIELGAEYPLSPPRVSFQTPIFHPNVDFKTGEVCLDVLKSDWSPAWGIATVCRAIVALLTSPNPDSPLNCDAGNLLRNNDVVGFNSLARMYTIEYAI